MIEKVDFNGKNLAIIIRNNFNKEGIEFVTPNAYSQQLAYMHHKEGHVIAPHFHNRVSRTVEYTQEVLVVKSGKMKVIFYDENCNYISEQIIFSGDVILLASGGHGFEMLEETIMLEIKQGPYVGEADKTRFEPKRL